MTAKLSLFVVGCTVFCISGFAQQIDAAALRGKYGEPLARETFQVRPNVQAIVNYGPGHQVCRIEFPAVEPAIQTSELIDEPVPPSVRGKEIRRMVISPGRNSVSSVEYENVDISELQINGRRTGVTISFNRPDRR